MNTQRYSPAARPGPVPRRPEPDLAEPHSANPARRPAAGTRAMALVGFAAPALGAAEPAPLFG
jgi:hypothetical protein